MHLSTPYFHSLDGRLRIKIPAVKGTPAEARRLERDLGTLRGILEVRANPTTGNVLILYHADEVNQYAIVSSLTDGGWLRRDADGQVQNASAVRGIPQKVAESLVATAVESALRGLVSAII